MLSIFPTVQATVCKGHMAAAGAGEAVGEHRLRAAAFIPAKRAAGERAAGEERTAPPGTACGAAGYSAAKVPRMQARVVAERK